jgi:hypothetical protein
MASQRANMVILLRHVFDPWEKISSSQSAVSATCQGRICAFYGIEDHICQLLGVAVGRMHVTSGNIWPKHTLGLQLHEFGLEKHDVSNVRNFLRLHSSVEKAFDCKRLTFVPQNDNIVCHVLDPKILPLPIGATGRSFIDFHLQPLHFRNIQRPLRRLLAVHVQKALRHAVHQGWMDACDLPAYEVRAQELARHSAGKGGARVAHVGLQKRVHSALAS